MTDTTPTPADLLRAAAERARETGDPLNLVAAGLLEVTAQSAPAASVDETARAALAVARQLLGTTVAAPPDEEQEPTLLRWGLDDVMYGDDDTTTVLLSGPDREPYWLELDPERTAALRDALAGPATPLAAPAVPEEQAR